MKRFIILLIFCLISPMTFGEILLQTSTTNPSVNQPFIVQVSFQNESKKDYTIEGIDAFQVLGKSSKSSISIINGQRTSSSSDVYHLLPINTGKVTLQAKVLNSQITSNKLILNTQKENINTATKDTEFKINIKNNSTYYFGEKIPFIERFLTTTPITSLGYVTPMSSPGISSKDVTPINSNGQFQQQYFRTPDGQQGLEVITYEGILMPNSSGEKIISTGKIGYTTSSDDDFFFGRGSETKYLGGQDIKINILPLPQDAPNNYQNVVGTPKISYTWNRDKVNYGESVVLNITINGNANLDTLEKIIPGSINGFNTFESIKSFDEAIISNKYNANKIFEIAFIPRVSGDITIPKIEIPYFNTHTKKYEFLVVPEKNISVSGNANNIPNNNVNNNSSNDPNQHQETLNSNNQGISNQEITISSINNENTQNLDKNYIYLIIGLIVIIIIQGIFIIKILYNKNSKNYESLSSLEHAKNNKEFYEAYCAFMKSKFNFSPKVHLEDRLVRLGLDEDIILINREIEENYYLGENLNKKELVKRLKNVLKKIK